MFKSGFRLSTDEQLQAAMHNQTLVQAWQDGQALNHGYLVQSVTNDAVKIDGKYYMRSTCTFIVR